MSFCLDNKTKSVDVYFDNVEGYTKYTEYESYKLYLALIPPHVPFLSAYKFWKCIIEGGYWFVDYRNREIYIVER